LRCSVTGWSPVPQNKLGPQLSFVDQIIVAIGGGK
jgi:hypothetical protein